MLADKADPFATPEILPEWYLYPVFQILGLSPTSSSESHCKPWFLWV